VTRIKNVKTFFTSMVGGCPRRVCQPCAVDLVEGRIAGGDLYRSDDECLTRRRVDNLTYS